MRASHADYRIEKAANSSFGAAFLITTGQRIHTPEVMGMDQVMIQIRYDIARRNSQVV